MPSAGLVIAAVLVPIAASLFYSSAQLPGGNRFLPVDNVKSLLRMAQGSPKLAVAPYEVPQPAFLYVAAETGELASTAEFNDWYDHEHVPLRLGHIPDFLSGARYEATDGKTPRYNALYDIKDFHLFSEPKYSNLRANRSPREADLVKRLDTLDRRTCKTIYDSGREEYTAASTAPYITTLYIQPEQGKDAQMRSWLQQGFLSAMKAVPGWKRTSIHEVVDSLIISANASPQSNVAAKYLIVNEWSSADSASKAGEALAASKTGSAAENAQIETRQWSLYRAWDNQSLDKPAAAPHKRIPPTYPPPGTSEVGDKIRARRGPRGLTPLDGALLNAPEMANGWNTHVGAVRNKNSLPGDIRELLILRVAARNAAAYEWIHHEHVGRDAGLTTPQLVWLRDLSRRPPPVSSPGPFTPLQAAAFAFADESTWHSKIPQKVFDNLRSELAKQLPKGVTVEQQLTEVAVTTGTYNMVSRFLLAADVGEHANVLTPYPAADCQQRTIFVANGVTLNTYVVKHDDREKKPWIVLVNSLMTDYTMWDGVMSRLSSDYNILAYDQRGHGKSSVPPEPCTLEQLADDIATLLHQLTIPTPIKAVIGVSQGGATTLKFAARHGDKVEKLVVCDTQVTSPQANIAAWDQRIEMARSKGMGALADATLPRWFPPESQLVQGAQEHLVRPMIENTQVEGFVAGARALQGYDMSGEITQALKGKKTLLIAGEKDGKLPEGLSKTQQQLSGEGVDVQYFTVPGAGHLPMFVNNGLEAFLDKLEPFLRD